MNRSAMVVVRTTTEAKGVRVAYSISPDLSSPSYSHRANTVRGAARVRLTGLTAGQTYYYAPYIDGVLYNSRVGTLKALPEGATSFTCCFASCAESNNHVVHTTIKDLAPDFFIHMGDFHYGDLDARDVGPHEAMYDTQLAQSHPLGLFENVPLFPMFDDHEYGDTTQALLGVNSRERRFSVAAFRNRMPVWAFEENQRLPIGSVYYGFTVGRLRVLMLDCMSARSPVAATDNASKSMLGTAQKAWFKAQMLAAEAAGLAICIMSPKPWIGATGSEGWEGYSTERAEISQYIADEGLGNRVMMLNGDMHGLAIDSGANSDYSSGGGAAIPVMVAAALDRAASVKGGPWDIGLAATQRGQFGRMAVTDTGGATISVVWQARNHSGAILFSHSFTLAT